MITSRPFKVAALLAALFAVPCCLAWSQDAEDSGGPSAAAPASPAAGEEPAQAEPAKTAPALPMAKGINLLALLMEGGWFMLPLVFMFIIMVTFAVERTIALRRSKVLPDELISGLGKLGSGSGFDPRSAYRLCQQFPSAASTVIRAMLLKVGRPHSEVEHAVLQASEREAGRLYANVRWLNLTAGLSPLLGLLGTVWGMIIAFYGTTQLQAGQNKAEALAQGIYTALGTTLVGLGIAIPAAFLAHLFEGRIQSLFMQIDELLFNLLPQIERFEGRVRFSRNQSEVEESADELDQPAPAATPK